MSYVLKDTYLAVRRRAGVGVMPDHPCERGHFAWHTDTSTGYVRCAECQRERNREWQKANYRRHLALKRSARLLRTLGVTVEQKLELLATQEGNCLLCHLACAPENARVDHDHSTGRVRGILCNDCNLFLGRIEANVDRVYRCLKYLQSR